MSLDEWGWDEQWAQQVAVHGVDSTGVARVVSQDRASWPLQTQSGPENTRLRSASGAGNEEQVLAANVDKVWIVHGLDLPFNSRRLERYLAVVWESGASPNEDGEIPPEA